MDMKMDMSLQMIGLRAQNSSTIHSSIPNIKWNKTTHMIIQYETLNMAMAWTWIC